MVNGGKAVWETDEKSIGANEVVKEYLEPNSLFGNVKFCDSNVLLFEIDTKRTKFSDFYNWNDMLDGRVADSAELWRPWMWVGDTEMGGKDSWGWKQEMETLSLGKFGTADTLWQLLKRSII